MRELPPASYSCQERETSHVRVKLPCDFTVGYDFEDKKGYHRSHNFTFKHWYSQGSAGTLGYNLEERGIITGESWAIKNCICTAYFMKYFNQVIQLSIKNWKTPFKFLVGTTKHINLRILFKY